MGHIEKGMSALSLENIIMEAGSELASMVQWSEHADWLPSKLGGYYTSKCLIELAETMVCGSVGGFDKGQQRNDGPGMWGEDLYDSLFARWLWLFNHYVGGTNLTNLGHEGWLKVRDLKKFFAKKK
jgi:hypothetical protein